MKSFREVKAVIQLLFVTEITYDTPHAASTFRFGFISGFFTLLADDEVTLEPEAE